MELTLTKPSFGLGRVSLSDPSFRRFAQFGLIDNALLIVPTLAGVELDGWIADHIGAKGYGAILGASIGNAISDGLAGLADSPEAAWGTFAGALVPVALLAVPLALKIPLTGTTKYIVGGLALAMVLASVARRSAR